MAWSGSPDGFFSIKSTYQSCIQENGSNHNSKLSKAVSSWKGPQRVKVLLWKAVSNILLTNEQRFYRHFSDSDACLRCTERTECITCVLRDCALAVEVWLKFIAQCLLSKFFTDGREDWLLETLLNQRRYNFPVPWNIIFGVTLDKLWQARISIMI